MDEIEKLKEENEAILELAMLLEEENIELNLQIDLLLSDSPLENMSLFYN